MSNQSGGDPNKKKGQFSEMILGNIKPRTGKETTKWLSDLTQDDNDEIPDEPVEVMRKPAGPTSSPAPLPAQFAHPSISQTQVKWVDRLFDLFQQYEAEYNRQISDPKLRIETDRASITPELISKMQGSDHFHYTGRLSMRSWTLMIRGNLSHIEGYVIPSDHLIGFENNVNAYTRFFEFFPVWDGELKWSMDPNNSFGMGQLPTVAKQIFGHLIKVSKGDASEEDVFGFGSSKPGLPPKPMGDDQFAHLKPNSSDYLKNHTGIFEDDKPIQTLDSAQKTAAVNPESTPTQPPKSAQQMSRAQQSTTGRNRIPKATAAAAAAASAASAANAANNANTAVSAEMEATLSASEAAVSASSGSGEASNAQKHVIEPDLNSALDFLGRAITRELERLSKEGAKAFENHDFAQVEKLMKKTSKVKAMREQILEQMSEWKKIMSEQ